MTCLDKVEQAISGPDIGEQTKADPDKMRATRDAPELWTPMMRLSSRTR